MTITIEIPPELEAELTRQASTRGVAIDAYAVSLLEDAAGKSQSPPPDEVMQAIERLKTFGRTHGLSLGDMTIRELRHEARP